jgi:DNA-binding MarR family transcriptional regulator
VTDRLHEVLNDAMGRLFELRGLLDPSQAAPGLGVSVSEAMALRHLSQRSCTQQELGSRLALEKSTVSRLVDAMVGKGWVDKEPDPDNRRYRVLALSQNGAEAAARVAAAIGQRHRQMLATLSAQEREAVAIALPALVRALAAEPDGQARSSEPE